MSEKQNIIGNMEDEMKEITKLNIVDEEKEDQYVSNHGTFSTMMCCQSPEELTTQSPVEKANSSSPEITSHIIISDEDTIAFAYDSLQSASMERATPVNMPH